MKGQRKSNEEPKDVHASDPALEFGDDVPTKQERERHQLEAHEKTDPNIDGRGGGHFDRHGADHLRDETLGIVESPHGVVGDERTPDSHAAPCPEQVEHDRQSKPDDRIA